LPVIENCNDCGACCREQGGLPISYYIGILKGRDNHKPPPALLAEMEATLAEWRRGFFPPDGSPCIWYDAETKRCKHYEHRPDICRDGLKVGDDGCRRWRRQYGIDPVVKLGIRGGKLVRT